MISKVHGLPDAPVTEPGKIQNGGSMFMNEYLLHTRSAFKPLTRVDPPFTSI